MLRYVTRTGHRHQARLHNDRIMRVASEEEVYSQASKLSPVKSVDNKTEKRRRAKPKEIKRLRELGLAVARRVNLGGLAVPFQLDQLVHREGEHRPGNQHKFNQPAQRNTPLGLLLCCFGDVFPGQDAVARGFGKDEFRNLGRFFFVR